MNKVYKTAMGKLIDMDQLRLMNEETIAVGNMKVNARGDELGLGGEIIRTRNQVMTDYYKLDSGITLEPSTYPEGNEQTILEDMRSQEERKPAGTLRGSLADSVAKKRG